VRWALKHQIYGFEKMFFFHVIDSFTAFLA
jgi:hypothetical protein